MCSDSICEAFLFCNKYANDTYIYLIRAAHSSHIEMSRMKNHTSRVHASLRSQPSSVT